MSLFNEEKVPLKRYLPFTRTSVRRLGRVFCKGKIWKGAKAARGSHDSGE